jgi:23S rRNA (uracil1939-C5)-methyltransferase
MEYSLYYNFKSEKIELAIHPRGSHSKMPIKTSSIEREEIFEKAQEIVKHLNETGDEARNYQSLLLRCNQNGDVEGGLFEKGKPHPVFNNLEDKILGKTYSYSPNGFFQINLPVYEMALNAIKSHIHTDKVLDLYSGVGTIGLSVARDKNLTLVEVDKSAYNELLNNTEHLNNVTAVLDKSENVTNYIEPDMTVILDPPRAGCDTKLIDKLLEVKPKCIIYLSCNPATEARDVKKLLEKYQIKEIKTFNFFPRTPHIENLVVLSL